MRSRRILITGLSSHLGGRLAQALESDPATEAIVGIDLDDPRHPLERTEFVRVATDPQTLHRILRAAAIDTVVDTRLIADPLLASPGRVRQVNVAETANLVAACTAHGGPVRKLVFKSSAHYYGCGREDPAFFTEQMRRAQPPRIALKRDAVAAEAVGGELAETGRTVTILRVADEIGGGQRSSHLALLSLPVIPTMLGFDPRWQFVHQDDVVGALAHAVRHELPGVYNVAGDGVLALSELISLLGKRSLPVVPPWGAGFAAAQLRRLRLPVPVEAVRQLRLGRGLDNRKLKASGYAFRYTSREAALELRAQQRLRPLLRAGGESYRYEREVEEFLRWSPSVRTAPAPAATGANDTGDGPPPTEYDALGPSELIEVVPSLEPEALHALRRHEAAHQRRAEVLAALERALAAKRSSSPTGEVR
jgi:UDP-glucose 4-epimerase